MAVPPILHALPEILVVVFDVPAAEVVEEWQFGIVVEIVFPLLRVQDGKQHLGGVLPVVLVVAAAQFGGQIVGVACRSLIRHHVFRRQLAQRHPVHVLLLLLAEHGAHAHPVLNIAL